MTVKSNSVFLIQLQFGLSVKKLKCPVTTYGAY